MASNPREDRSLEEMELFDKEILACPYHYNKELRDNAPVYKDPETGIFIISKYELVKEAARKKDVFSNEFVLNLDISESEELTTARRKSFNLGKGTLLTIDDPEHKKYRALVKDFFVPEKIVAYEPWILDLSNNLIEKFEDNGRCNFIKEFARPLPLSVILHVLGVPLDRTDDCFRWTLNSVTALSGVASDDELIEAHNGIAEQHSFFADEIEARRGNPKEDLLSVIANAKYEDERYLSTEESVSFCTQFLVAGNETTTATLAEAMRQLCLFPKEQVKIQNDPSIITNLVEESLRLATPTSNMWRVAKEDCEIGGVTIPEGSTMLLKYFSSNHDEEIFEEPMRFDVTRENARSHIAFGFGIHVCIGQLLSRQEMVNGWQVMFQKLKNFKLDTDPDELKYMPNILLRGLEELPITFDKIK